MKKTFAYLIISLFLFASCGQKQEKAAQEEESAAEVVEWIDLFDGSTLEGWKEYNKDELGELWKVMDGMIVCDGAGGAEGSSLITREQFDNFELSVEWKIAEGGNSGILYHVVEDPAYKHAYETGPEYQLLDDGGWAGDPITVAQMVASDYDMIAAPADKPTKPAGEWNESKVVFNDGHVEHWLNGAKVVEFEAWSDEWYARKDSVKWKDYPGYGKYKKGSIALQEHGFGVWFRSVKLKKL
ncbi:DUF1080 domain-containing protein [Bacteroidota bacterium]